MFDLNKYCNSLILISILCLSISNISASSHHENTFCIEVQNIDHPIDRGRNDVSRIIVLVTSENAICLTYDLPSINEILTREIDKNFLDLDDRHIKVELWHVDKFNELLDSPILTKQFIINHSKESVRFIISANGIQMQQ